MAAQKDRGNLKRAGRACHAREDAPGTRLQSPDGKSGFVELQRGAEACLSSKEGKGTRAASALGHAAGAHLYPFLLCPQTHPGRTWVSAGLFGRSGNVRATAASLTPGALLGTLRAPTSF